MSQSIPRASRSIAVIVGAVVLLALALVYAAIAALFGILLSRPTHMIVRIGDTNLYSDFAVSGVLVFGLLCLLSGYGGLAAIRRWSHGMPVAHAAAWATIGLGIYGIWVFLSAMIMVPGLPRPPFAIGINMPFEVSVVTSAIGLLVLWTTWRPAEKSP
jgi:hypothetical protein